MPLLQFETTLSLSAAEQTSFADTVTELYTTEMDTTAGHVAVTIRSREQADLHLGRAVDGPLLFLDADIRRGRSVERKRAVFEISSCRRAFECRSSLYTMTNWKAVAVGFVVMVIAGALATGAPIIGHIGAGIIGGLAAGYIAGGGLMNGAWHGLLAGSVAGIALTLIFAVVFGVIGLAGGPLGGALGFGGVLVAGLVVTFILAVDSALAGAIGAVFA